MNIQPSSIALALSVIVVRRDVYFKLWCVGVELTRDSRADVDYQSFMICVVVFSFDIALLSIKPSQLEDTHWAWVIAAYLARTPYERQLQTKDLQDCAMHLYQTPRTRMLHSCLRFFKPGVYSHPDFSV